MAHRLDGPLPPPGSRIVVAMSGGVDSSVVAALLVEAGFEVVGVTLQLYDHAAATGRGRACCAGRDVHDARAVADKLGIPHYVLDYEERFRRAVIDDFVDTYVAGRTPVPCVRCNQRIKFADLLNLARELGAMALATGHYARRVEGSDGVELHRARERSRDQSYFLFATTADLLAFLLFPLGSLDKQTTRTLARRFDLPVSEKPDSQDICFVPNGSYSDLIRKMRPEAEAPGDVVHVDGRTLASHAGVVDFTVGQRRGVGVALHERVYVVDIDAAQRRITVGPRRSSLCIEALVEDFNWLAPPLPNSVIEAEVKHRYNEPPVAAELTPAEDGTVQVAFVDAQAGVAPGQACVAYAGDRLLGGGWIKTAPRLA